MVLQEADLQQLMGGAAPDQADVVDVVQDGGETLVPGPRHGVSSQEARQLCEEGDDDCEGEDPPAAGEEAGGVSRRSVAGASGPAGGEVPGGVPQGEGGVQGGDPGEEGEQEPSEER